MNQSLLHLKSISKRFGSTRALQDVSFSLASGEILGLVGENGAGKSTLMKILAGIVTPDSGSIVIDSSECIFQSPREALDSGIALVHQELNLCENLTVTENLFLGRELSITGFLQRNAMSKKAELAIRKVGLSISPETPVYALTIADKQLVEIARAVMFKRRVIIMDEPTASLSAGESDRLFECISELKNAGVAIIYISHRLDEVIALADRTIALRDGRVVGELSRAETTRDSLIGLLVGGAIRKYEKKPKSGLPVLFEVDLASTVQYPETAISFKLHKGEILGIAGLVGAGRTALLEGLFGITPLLTGTIRINGHEQKIRDPVDAVRCGLGLVPEDRKQHGLLLELAIDQNIILAELRRLCSFGFRRFQKEHELSKKQILRLGIVCASTLQKVKELSGGNQQKIALAKWLVTNPTVLLLDEPTRGVDVRTKNEIYQIIEDLSEAGLGICVVSSDQEELLRISDRVLVMSEGMITGELTGADIDEQRILSLAMHTVRACRTDSFPDLVHS